jgi:hypothetical protein
MIRLFIGFFLLFGVVGTLDFDQDAELVMLCILAAIGIILIYFGLSSIKFKE